LEDFRQPIPRYDMAKYLVLVLISKDRFNISEYDADEILADIPDGDQVPEMYRYLVSAAYGSGLITGFDDGSFKGDRFITRAQAAVVYCRFSDILNGKETAKPEAPAQPTVPQQPAIPVPVVPDQPQQSEQPQQPAPEAPAQPAAPKAATSDDVIAEVIRLTNEERAKEGKKALMVDTSMRECSDIRADEITGVFSHTRPNGENCFSLNPTDYWVVGENIVMVPVGSRTVVEVAEYMMDLWMNSPGHRANILKDGFTAISVGVAIKDGYAFGVQNFIDRRDTSTYAEP
ncbi:MAG: S-layer homology domain-containing protein, partial [Firmicutes bacterium]|nr:S-layer homology domain-containing protein [Bacillota bacterium]